MFLDFEKFKQLSAKYGLRTVPFIAENVTVVNIPHLVDGKSMIDHSHIREGIVVKPMHEKRSYSLGRVVLKIISREYLLKDEVDNYNI